MALMNWKLGCITIFLCKSIYLQKPRDDISNIYIKYFYIILGYEAFYEGLYPSDLSTLLTVQIRIDQEKLFS